MYVRSPSPSFPRLGEGWKRKRKMERKEKEDQDREGGGIFWGVVQNGSCTWSGHPMHTYLYANLTGPLTPLSYPLFAYSLVPSPSTSTSLYIPRPFPFSGAS